MYSCIKKRPINSRRFSRCFDIAMLVEVALGLLAAVALLLLVLNVLPAQDWETEFSATGFSHLKKDKHGEYIQTAMRRKHLGQLPPVFPNAWYCLVASRHLRSGDVKLVSALGQQFAVFRNDNGQAHVLDAYCPHLGANMAVGGTVEGDCLVCPFHGWRFRGSDGACTRIPYSESGKIPEVARVKVWPSCEMNGTVMVWFHAEGSEPTWWPPPLEEVEQGGWCPQGSTTHHVACHLQDIAENGADIAHFDCVHGPGEVSALKHEWTLLSWGPNPEAHLNCLQITHSLVAWSCRLSFLDLHLEILQVGPAMVYMRMKSKIGSFITIQTILPEGPLHMRVTHTLFAQSRRMKWILKLFMFSQCSMLERDVRIWNHKKYQHQPVLVKEDRYLNKYRRWFSQFYSPNSPTLKSLREVSLDW